MVKLHIGCGKRDFGPDWIGIDQADFPHIKHKDVKSLQFENDSVDIIYSSHLIAYFDRIEIISILNEWKRVLKSGGTLRLATPDFNVLSYLHQTGVLKLEQILGPLYGRMEGNRNFIYHKTTYTFQSLKELLEGAGFNNVRRYDWRDTDHAQFDDHSQAYVPHFDKQNGTLISLNLECNKF